MPGRDRTGPQGLGWRTGKGFGPCGRGFGFGFGQGRGMGRGRGNQYRFGQEFFADNMNVAAEDNITELKAQAEVVEKYLHSIKAKINDLEEKQVD